MRYVTIQIPIIDAGGDPEKRRLKMLEEIDEFLNEVSTGTISKSDMLAEFFDVAQTTFAYMLADAKEMLPNDAAVDFAKTFLLNANVQHVEKMRNYATDRGWKVC